MTPRLCAAPTRLPACHAYSASLLNEQRELQFLWEATTGAWDSVGPESLLGRDNIRDNIWTLLHDLDVFDSWVTRLRAWSGITGWRFESSSAHL